MVACHRSFAIWVPRPELAPHLPPSFATRLLAAVATNGGQRFPFAARTDGNWYGSTRRLHRPLHPRCISCDGGTLLIRRGPALDPVRARKEDMLFVADRDTPTRSSDRNMTADAVEKSSACGAGVVGT